MRVQYIVAWVVPWPAQHLIACTQVGQLYVWGLLKWLLLPERALRFIESSRACAPCYNSRSFIAASGPAASAAGGAPPLPVSYTPAGWVN